MKKKLVLGVGNAFRSDDSIGPRVVDLLAQNGQTGANLEKQSGEGTALMQAWKEYDQVILIDAVRSGAAAGTIHRFDAQEEFFEPDFFHYSSHAFGVAEAIEMSRVLGTLPHKLLVVGVEGRCFEPGEALSPQVEEALAKIVSEIGNWLQCAEKVP